MRNLERKDILFDSASGDGKTAGYIFTSEKVKPFCILQISHGMCEYILRYEEFANFLTQNGVVVCGNDHMGHGKTAASPEDLGFFGGNGGRRFVLQDLAKMNEIIKNQFSGLPVVLFGHSMGSFYARKYAAEYKNTIDALIICGSGNNPLAALGAVFVRVLSAIKGERYRSDFIFKMAFGNYLKKIENPKTKYDWISHDEKIVKAFNEDPLCAFNFTLNGYHELFSTLKEVSGKAWAQEVPNLPIFMVQGTDDPVGNYAKGTAKVRDLLLAAGKTKLEYKNYDNMRHEIFNEIGREQVYEDILTFVKKAANN